MSTVRADGRAGHVVRQRDAAAIPANQGTTVATWVPVTICAGAEALIVPYTFSAAKRVAGPCDGLPPRSDGRAGSPPGHSGAPAVGRRRSIPVPPLRQPGVPASARRANALSFPPHAAGRPATPLRRPRPEPAGPSRPPDGGVRGTYRFQRRLAARRRSGPADRRRRPGFRRSALCRYGGLAANQRPGPRPRDWPGTGGLAPQRTRPEADGAPTAVLSGGRRPA